MDGLSYYDILYINILIDWLISCFDKAYQLLEWWSTWDDTFRWANDPCSLKLAVKSISLKADWYAGWTFDRQHQAEQAGSVPLDQWSAPPEAKTGLEWQKKI